MKNIYLINGAKAFASSAGKLNATMQQTAEETLTALGYVIRQVEIDKGYNIEEELKNLLWADAIIYQMPGWWMGEPWIVKKYIDEVFSAGYGLLYESDGRTRSDSSKKYGSGGLVKDKKYMLSLTWNAPQEAFDDPAQFFHGQGVDGVYLHFHKANQFTGMQPLSTFICTDVVKQPNVPENVARYKQHLKTVFAG